MQKASSADCPGRQVLRLASGGAAAARVCLVAAGELCLWTVGRWEHFGATLLADAPSSAKAKRPQLSVRWANWLTSRLEISLACSPAGQLDARTHADTPHTHTHLLARSPQTQCLERVFVHWPAS